MTLQDKLNVVMGIWEDKREPSIVHFPSMSKCPVQDCEERGRYTNCYLEKTIKDCYIYQEFIQS